MTRARPRPRSRCLSCSSCSSPRVSATIRPPVRWRPRSPSSSSSSVSQTLGRLERAAAPPSSSRWRDVRGVALGELVDRDLEVEAARVRAGRLAVQLPALEEHDLDPLAREVVGERGAGEAAADDEHVGLVGSAPRARARQPAPQARRRCGSVLSRHGRRTHRPRSSRRRSPPSAIGRTGDARRRDRQLGDRRRRGRAAISAAICRWQFRPWQRPIVARVKALDDVDVRMTSRSPRRAAARGSPRSGRRRCPASASS